MSPVQKLDRVSEAVAGSGMPLIMLHGWGQSRAQMKPLASLLSAASAASAVSDPHLIDLPGFGESAAPQWAWSAFEYADFVVAYLDEKGIDRADILGHSFGGKVALCLSIRYPHRVRKLVLMASSGLKRHRTWVESLRYYGLRYASRTLRYLDRQLHQGWFDRYFAPRFGSTDYKSSSGVMRQILVRTVNEDLSNLFPEIKAPSLILWGLDDRDTPVEMAHRLHEGIAHSQLQLMAHKDHHLLDDVGAHLCAHYIRPFLTEFEATSEGEV